MRRWLKLAAAGLLAFSFGFAAAPAARAADAAAGQRQEAQAPLRFSKHALSRMNERGVSPEQVRETVEKGETFRYFHQGRWKTGYYDPDAKLFIATADGLVITVIPNATRRYVQGLKRKKP